MLVTLLHKPLAGGILQSLPCATLNIDACRGTLGRFPNNLVLTCADWVDAQSGLRVGRGGVVTRTTLYESYENRLVKYVDLAGGRLYRDGGGVSMCFAIVTLGR